MDLTVWEAIAHQGAEDLQLQAGSAGVVGDHVPLYRVVPERPGERGDRPIYLGGFETRRFLRGARKRPPFRSHLATVL